MWMWVNICKFLPKYIFSSYIDRWQVCSKSGSSNDEFEDNGHQTRRAIY